MGSFVSQLLTVAEFWPVEVGACWRFRALNYRESFLIENFHCKNFHDFHFSVIFRLGKVKNIANFGKMAKICFPGHKSPKNENHENSHTQIKVMPEILLLANF
jgi:hypothetical protein